MAHNYTTTNIYTLSINGQEYKIKTVPFHATEEEWELIDYIPKNGELIVYDEDLNHANKRFKFGDGQLKANQLPFASNSESGQTGTGLEKIEVGTGLKVSEKVDNKQTIAFDEEVVFFINCN